VPGRHVLALWRPVGRLLVSRRGNAPTQPVNGNRRNELGNERARFGETGRSESEVGNTERASDHQAMRALSRLPGRPGTAQRVQWVPPAFAGALRPASAPGRGASRALAGHSSRTSPVNPGRSGPAVSEIRRVTVLELEASQADGAARADRLTALAWKVGLPGAQDETVRSNRRDGHVHGDRMRVFDGSSRGSISG
jgi:hypothetical protein